MIKKIKRNIKIRMYNIGSLSIKFKDKEIINTGHFTLSKIGIIILNEFAFNVIIYIWYLLFMFGIIDGPNPFFALILSLLQNIILFTYLLMMIGLSYDDLVKYTIILLVFKIMPIYSMMNYMSVSFFDVYSSIYLYIIYMFLILVIMDIFLRKNIDIIKILKTDITNDRYDVNVSNKIYDTVYNDMILRII
jgi:hypothetical protein